MRNRRQWLCSCFVVTLMCAACHKEALREPNLEPDDARPVYCVSVEDGEEARLLHQQLGMEILRVEGRNVLFFDTKGGVLDTLRALGYAPEPVAALQAFYRVVKVGKKGREEDLIQTGVKLINRERDHWIVRGNLTQLKLLKEQGFAIAVPDHEPRPREVQIRVKHRGDIQRVSELHVDIYSVVGTKENGFLIYGGAFDYQIDALKQNNFQVTIKPTLEEGGRK